MKSVLIGILTIWLFSQSDYAQDTTKNSLKQSKFALQFQIDNNFTLKSFQGNTLSFKYHIYDESAVRLGFSVNGFVETNRQKNDIEVSRTKSYEFTINAQFIQYIKTFEDVSLYTGGGPLFFKRYNTTSSPGYENMWYLGLSGILGIEWFFKKNMSLTAEYGLSLIYSVRDEKYSDHYYSKEIILGENNMLKFGISIYI